MNKNSSEDSSNFNLFEDPGQNIVGDNKTQKLSDITTKTGNKNKMFVEGDKSAKSL